MKSCLLFIARLGMKGKVHNDAIEKFRVLPFAAASGIVSFVLGKHSPLSPVFQRRQCRSVIEYLIEPVAQGFAEVNEIFVVRELNLQHPGEKEAASFFPVMDALEDKPEFLFEEIGNS